MKPNQTRQGCVVITAALWAAGDPGLRKRLLTLLHQKGRSFDMIRCGRWGSGGLGGGEGVPVWCQPHSASS